MRSTAGHPDSVGPHHGFISAGDTITLLIPTVERDKVVSVQQVVDDALHVYSDRWAAGPAESPADNTTLYAVESQYTVAVDRFDQLLENVAAHNGLHHVAYTFARSHHVVVDPDADTLGYTL